MRIQHKDHKRPTLEVDHCFCKSKIHSPRRGYLSPVNSIVLEIAAALLFISVTNSCRFWGSFVETQARLQQTCLFSWVMHALRAYCHGLHFCTLSFTLLHSYTLTLLQPGDMVCSALTMYYHKNGISYPDAGHQLR